MRILNDNSQVHCTLLCRCSFYTPLFFYDYVVFLELLFGMAMLV
jgi:hypothetical protein